MKGSFGSSSFNLNKKNIITTTTSHNINHGIGNNNSNSNYSSYNHTNNHNTSNKNNNSFSLLNWGDSKFFRRPDFKKFMQTKNDFNLDNNNHHHNISNSNNSGSSSGSISNPIKTSRQASIHPTSIYSNKDKDNNKLENINNFPKNKNKGSIFSSLSTTPPSTSSSASSSSSSSSAVVAPSIIETSNDALLTSKNNKKPVTCDKCDGKHETSECPYYRKDRDNHPDAQKNFYKKLGGTSTLPGAIIRNGRVERQPGDGSCLFHSLSFGLRDGSNASSLRREVCSFINKYPQMKIADTPLSDWIKWDSGGSVGSYTRRMASGAWGGGIEMASVSIMKNVNVHVYERSGSGFTRISAFDHPNNPESKKTVRVLYCGGVHYGNLLLLLHLFLLLILIFNLNF